MEEVETDRRAISHANDRRGRFGDCSVVVLGIQRCKADANRADRSDGVYQPRNRQVLASSTAVRPSAADCLQRSHSLPKDWAGSSRVGPGSRTSLMTKFRRSASKGWLQ